MNRAKLMLTAGGILMAATLSANEFADDFSADFINLNYRVESQNLAENTVPISFNGSQLLVEVIDSDPLDDERGEFSINPNGPLETLESSVTTSLVRPVSGRVGYAIQGRFYNSIVDGGPAQNDSSLDRRFGDVNVYLELYLYSDPSQDSFLYCFESRTEDGGFDAAVLGEEPCGILQTLPVLGGTYSMAVGVDKSTNQMFVRVDDEEIRIDAPTPMFDVASPFYQVRARTRDGASTAQYSINSIGTSNGPIDLSLVGEPPRYSTDDFDDFSDDPNRSKTIVDGRLRLSAINDSVESNNDSFLRLENQTDYLEAEIEYSSESSVDLGADGFTAVRIAGGLYSELDPDTVDGNTGNIFATVQLIENVGTGLVGEYCVIRSDNSDFSAITDLADMLDDGRCPTFEGTYLADTPYKAVIDLDREARTVTFRLGDDTKVFNIQSDIFDGGFNLRAQTRISEGATGTIVGYFDNLRNDPDALTNEEMNMMAGSSDSQTGGGSSGGGCSVVSGGSDSSLLMWLLIAVAGVCFKARKV